MTTLLPRPAKVEMGFTAVQLTGFGGWSVLGQMAGRLDLPQLLSSVSVKQRAWGMRDAETLWSLIASLAAGNGSLSDLDALREDWAGQRLLGQAVLPQNPAGPAFRDRQHVLHVIDHSAASGGA